MDHKELDRGDGWVVGFPATHPITFQSIYQSINGPSYVHTPYPLLIIMDTQTHTV